MGVNELLADAGLGKRESKVYLALLELGITTAGPLVKKSGVPNSKIYEILESLQSKGLVSWIVKGKIKHFQAGEPGKIMALFEAKKRRMEAEMPRLETLQLRTQARSSVELFEGFPAIRGMLVDITKDARKGEKWYGFGTGATSAIPDVAAFYEWWGATKSRLGLKDHLLLSAQNRRTIEAVHPIFKKPQKTPGYRKTWEFKYSMVSFPGDVAIFRNKVVILSWQENPIGILITNQHLANEYHQFFLGVWQSA